MITNVCRPRFFPRRYGEYGALFSLCKYVLPRCFVVGCQLLLYLDVTGVRSPFVYQMQSLETRTRPAWEMFFFGVCWPATYYANSRVQ